MKKEMFKLSIIMLAAGDSKRFHGNKMLIKIKDRPMYLYMIDKMQKVPATQKIIVTQYEEIIQYLKETGMDRAIKTVKNTHSEWGISYSIKLGVEACQSLLPAKEKVDSLPDAYLFAVCDQPWLRKESILTLIETFVKSNKGIACLAYQGRLGNPVIFDSSYKEELLRLQGDIGGKSLVKNHLDDVEFVEVSNLFELLDIDTRQEFNQELW